MTVREKAATTGRGSYASPRGPHRVLVGGDVSSLEDGLDTGTINALPKGERVRSKLEGTT